MRALLRSLVVTTPFLVGCELLDSVQATVIVGGLLAANAEVRLDNRFDVPAQVVASAWVGERESATSTEVPLAINDADVAVTFAGNRVILPAQAGLRGLYRQTDDNDAALVYVPGQSYTFRAALPDDRSVEYGGTLGTAPNLLTPAAVVLTPEPTPIAGRADVGSHPRNTALTISWPDGFGRYTYVSVFRADPNAPGDPMLVFDTRPESTEEILELVLGTPPAAVEVPGRTFAQDGLYAVVLVAMDRGTDLLPNTFLGSPVLVGSGAPRFLSVGTL